ncbi:MAG: YdcF family protein [Flavipsychrobacter sp.]|nr:YdcF family protein [Flavipsychrobacter sp.]
MFFILSKVLLYFIFPLTWVIVLAICSIVVKNTRRKRNLRIAAVVVFYLFSNNFLLNHFARVWDYPPATLPANSHYSCAIVLGGFSSSDRNEQGFFNLAADRFIQGVKLYKQGAVSHVLVSGGNGNLVPGAYHEGAWAAQQLAAVGLPADAILVENNSRNTLENGAFTRQLLAEKDLQPPYVLVTSGFHMRRSLLVFSREHLPVVPYPCNYTNGRSRVSVLDLLPSSDPLSTWPYYIKEVIGYAVYWAKGK